MIYVRCRNGVWEVRDIGSVVEIFMFMAWLLVKSLLQGQPKVNFNVGLGQGWDKCLDMF